MKAVGDEVKLRCLWGEVPRAGDVLQTRTGRQYLVRVVRGRALLCVVVKGLKSTMDWHWGRR